MSEPVKSGDTISVNYTGRFENGDVFDTSQDGEPLKFTVNSGQLIKGFDTAVIGMLAGDKKQVTINPEEGYGVRNDDMVADLPKDSIPEEMKLEVGMSVQLMDEQGQPAPAQVTEILGDIVKFDLNHPLAGKTLLFDIEVIETGLEPDAAHGCGGGCSCDDSGCSPGSCGPDGCSD